MTRQTLIAAAFGAALMTAAPPTHAAGYVVTDITAPTTPAGDYAYASSVNDHGQVLVLAVDPKVGTTFVDAAVLYDSHAHTYTAFPAAPGALALSTQPAALNDAGIVVGGYATAHGVFQGFSFQGGAFTPIDPFGSGNTEALGISNAGEIVGFVGRDAYIDVGRTISIIATGAPATSSSVAVGVNDAGVVDGTTLDALGGVTSFLDVGGTITSIVDPGHATTSVGGLNDLGVIVGGAGAEVGFNFTSSFVDDHGVFTDLIIPGAVASSAIGIDDLGDIVGSYTDAAGATHAFLATPAPEPATWALMLVGFGGLGAALRGRRGAMGA